MPDATFRAAQMEDASLGEFFSRPVKVASYSWGTGTTLFQTLNPWTAYFENPRVINRICNYHLLRCKLRVSIKINGNGFYYGRIMVAYNPLHDEDQCTVSRGFFIQDVVEASQRPKIFLDPTHSQGGDMLLPFFFFKDAMSICDEEWERMGELTFFTLNALQHANDETGDITISVFVHAEDVEISIPTSVEPSALVPQSGEEWSEAFLSMPGWAQSLATQDIPGYLTKALLEACATTPGGQWRNPDTERNELIRSLVKYPQGVRLSLLRSHVKEGGTVERIPELALDPIPEGKPMERWTYTKSKWEGGNTATRSNRYEPQSGEDEYGKGLISTPASIIARAAGALTKAPLIGPYAKATSMIANCTKEVAQMFGFSRPLDLQPVHKYRPTTAGNMAVTNLEDQSEKLAIDAKQELTVDPRTVGLSDVDEMDLKSIATRESYVATFGWNVSDTAEDLLFSTKVTPSIFYPLNQEIHMAASCFAALPFLNWRGSMEFRFQIVASNFHKGRLKIVFDPRALLGTEYNVQYVEVVDIADCKDFTIKVGWASAYGFLKVLPPDVSNQPWSAGSVVTPDQQYDNGVLGVYVVNELTTPGSTLQAVAVNVYAKMCDDVEFGALCNNVTNYTYFPQSGTSDDLSDYDPQSGMEEQVADKELTDEPSKPVQEETTASMAAPLSMMDNVLSVYMGEKITSARQLLKRYSFVTNWGAGTNADAIVQVTHPIYPLQRGTPPSAIHTTSTATAYNYYKMNLMTYFTPAFGGMRGGIRWKFVKLGSTLTSSFTQSARRVGLPGTRYSRTQVLGPGAIPPSNFAYEYGLFDDNAAGGISITNEVVTPSLEVEFPYQTQYRFAPAKRVATNDGTYPFCECFQHSLTSNAAAGDFVSSQAFVAAAEDFSCFFFLGSPIIYKAITDPAA